VAFLGDATEVVIRTGDVTLITKLPASAVPAIGANVGVSIASQTCTLLD
jgi:hypothetical protein